MTRKSRISTDTDDAEQDRTRTNEGSDELSRTTTTENVDEPSRTAIDEDSNEQTRTGTDDSTERIDFEVTPYAVEGPVDYEKLLEEFGAEAVTDEQISRFPDHPAIRRGVYFAGRDLDRYLAAAEAGETHSIVTGRGPSGPMHLGHVLPLYLARDLQRATGTHVLVPLSDDEKYLAKREYTFEEIGQFTRENLRDVLAIGFDPERTTILVDSADADVIYPIATRLAKYLTPATVSATYGELPNVGLSFYPAVQATHLLLPQLLEGAHPTLVPIAADQDPHVRVCRDVAAKEALPVEKPGALLGKFLPSLAGPGTMSSSGEDPVISLTDDRETVKRTIEEHAYTGGRSTVEAHREHGGDPSVDVPFQYLRYGFEPDDGTLAELEREYRNGALLSGELKAIAAERIGEFLAAHRERRASIEDLESALAPYRLNESGRTRALERAGVPRHY